MRPFISISLTILMLVALASSTFAQRATPRQLMAYRPNMGKFHGDRPILRILDLTDEQREQIREIHLKAQQDRLEFRNQLNEEQARLRTLITGSDIDINEANEVIEQIRVPENRAYETPAGHPHWPSPCPA